MFFYKREKLFDQSNRPQSVEDSWTAFATLNATNVCVCEMTAILIIARAIGKNKRTGRMLLFDESTNYDDWYGLINKIATLT